MNKVIKYILIVVIATTFSGCGPYNFTGTGTIDAKTFQVNYFQNTAELIEPGIERTFTLRITRYYSKSNQFKFGYILEEI